VQDSLEQCPLCGSDLSQTKYREIRARLRDQEEKKVAQIAEAELAIRQRLEKEFESQFAQDRRAAEKKAREDAEKRVQKVLAESALLLKKVQDSETREAETRAQAQAEIEKQKHAAEKKAKQEAAQQIKEITAARDLAERKRKESEDREAEIRREVKEEAEKERQRELKEQRQALEKDKTLALLKQQSDHNRQSEALQKRLKLMENQFQKKTANELGDGTEIELFDALRNSFHGDKITRVLKGQTGADILHEVLYKGESCGCIITDAKNRQGWQNTFVTKLRQDQVEAGAQYAILATTAFPAGKKALCIESGVIVVSPALVVYVADLLRQSMITMHVKGLSVRERSNKMNQLYDLITSEPYIKKFIEAGRLTQDILDLDAQEQKDHGIVWRKRGTLATRIKNVLRDVETEVAAIVESANDMEQVIQPAQNMRAAVGSTK